MNKELLAVVVTFLLTIAIAYPLGKYIAKVFKGEKTWLDFIAPFERMLFRLCGIG